MWWYLILGVLVLVAISMFFSYIIVPILCCFLGDFVFALYLFYDKIGPFVRSFTDNGVSFTIFCIIVVIIIFVANYFLLIFIAAISVKLAWIYNFAIVCIMSYSGFKFGVDQAFKADIPIFEIHYTTIPVVNAIITGLLLLILIVIGFSIRVLFFIGGESPIDYFFNTSSFEEEKKPKKENRVIKQKITEDDEDFEEQAFREYKKGEVEDIFRQYSHAYNFNMSDFNDRPLNNGEDYNQLMSYSQKYVDDFLKFWGTNDLKEADYLLRHNLDIVRNKIKSRKESIIRNIYYYSDDEFYKNLDEFKELVNKFIDYKIQYDEIIFCIDFITESEKNRN